MQHLIRIKKPTGVRLAGVSLVLVGGVCFLAGLFGVGGQLQRELLMLAGLALKVVGYFVASPSRRLV